MLKLAVEVVQILLNRLGQVGRNRLLHLIQNSPAFNYGFFFTKPTALLLIDGLAAGRGDLGFPRTFFGMESKDVVVLGGLAKQVFALARRIPQDIPIDFFTGAKPASFLLVLHPRHMNHRGFPFSIGVRGD